MFGGIYFAGYSFGASSGSTPTSTYVPVSIIREQSQTTPPFTPDSTLVDDPIVLVDDTAALSGGQITIIEGIRFKVSTPPPYAKIATYR